MRAWPKAEAMYAELIKDALAGFSLRGCKIALDCVHGATALVAPAVFRSPGATLSVIGGEPDRARTNATGATHTAPLAALVRAARADIGVA